MLLQKVIMFLFTFDASPAKNSSCTCPGAIINCWVNFDDFAGAEFIARKFVESQGWIIKKNEEEPLSVSPQWFPVGRIARQRNRCYNIARKTGLAYLCITYQEE